MSKQQSKFARTGNEKMTKDSLKPLRDNAGSQSLGETQWGSFVKPANTKSGQQNYSRHDSAPYDNTHVIRGSFPARSEYSNGGKPLTPYQEIRERLNRGMYELLYDKPCVRIGLGAQDGFSFMPRIKTAGSPTRKKDNGGFLGTRQEDKLVWEDMTPFEDPAAALDQSAARPGDDGGGGGGGGDGYGRGGSEQGSDRRRAKGRLTAVRARRDHERLGRFELEFDKPCVGPHPGLVAAASGQWTPPSTAGALSYNDENRHLNDRQVLYTRRGRRGLGASGAASPWAGPATGDGGGGGGGGGEASAPAAAPTRPPVLNTNLKSTRGRLSRELYGDLGGDELELSSLSPAAMAVAAASAAGMPASAAASAAPRGGGSRRVAAGGA